MSDEHKRRPTRTQRVTREWSEATPQSMQNAAGLITAALMTPADEERPVVLSAALTPIVQGGEDRILQTLSALVALCIRSINTMADLAEVEPQELWRLMATELENMNSNN